MLHFTKGVTRWARPYDIEVSYALHSQTPPEATFPERPAFEPFLGSDSWFDAGDIALGLALASPSTLNTLYYRR